MCICPSTNIRQTASAHSITKHLCIQNKSSVVGSAFLTLVSILITEAAIIVLYSNHESFPTLKFCCMHVVTKSIYIRGRG